MLRLRCCLPPYQNYWLRAWVKVICNWWFLELRYFDKIRLDIYSLYRWNLIDYIYPNTDEVIHVAPVSLLEFGLPTFFCQLLIYAWLLFRRGWLKKSSGCGSNSGTLLNCDCFRSVEMIARFVVRFEIFLTFIISALKHICNKNVQNFDIAISDTKAEREYHGLLPCKRRWNSFFLDC